MIERSTRACDPRDLRAAAHGRGSLWSNLLLVAIPIAAVIGVVAYLLARSLVFALLVGSGLLLLSVWSNLVFLGDVSRRRRSGADSAAVVEWRVSAEAVVEIEHLGSNGPAWVFFTNDGQALLLVGQWLLDKRSFPTLRFRLSCWADDGKPIRIDCRGKRVRPEEVAVALRAAHRFDAVNVLPARPASLQQDLDAALTLRDAGSRQRAS